MKLHTVQLQFLTDMSRETVSHCLRGRQGITTIICVIYQKSADLLESFAVAGCRVMRIDVHSWCRYIYTVAYPGIFSGGGGGVQQIQLRTEDRDDGDLGAVAP